MTRINIVSVKEISNKQLMAEYHESIRVFSYVFEIQENSRRYSKPLLFR